jgi:hypothetical protein
LTGIRLWTFWSHRPLEAGRTSLELDRRILGLFSLRTWLDLMDDGGFEVERHRPLI